MTRIIHRVHTIILNRIPTYVLADFIIEHRSVWSNRINICCRNNGAKFNHLETAFPREMTHRKYVKSRRWINYKIKLNRDLLITCHYLYQRKKLFFFSLYFRYESNWHLMYVPEILIYKKYYSRNILFELKFSNIVRTCQNMGSLFTQRTKIWNH